jgi:hypothetical protein
MTEKCHAKAQRFKTKVDLDRLEPTQGRSLLSNLSCLFCVQRKPRHRNLKQELREVKRSPLPLLAPVQNPSSLCAFASLREIFLS